MSILDYLVEPFTLPFMTRAMVVTVIAAVVCALLSCWLVMLGWSLMGDAISHAVLPGVVLAYIAGVPFAVGAVIAALVAVTLIGAVQRSGACVRTPLSALSHNSFRARARTGFSDTLKHRPEPYSFRERAGRILAGCLAGSYSRRHRGGCPAD